MKDLYIITQNLDAGGVEKAVCLQANAFQKIGYRVKILNLFYSIPIVDLSTEIEVVTITSFHSDRLKKHNIFYRLIRKIDSIIKLIYHLRLIDSGVVISTRNEFSILLSKFGKHDVRKIAELHHDHLHNKKLLNDFKYHYKNIDYFIHLTEMSKTEIEQVMIVTNKFTKNIVIPNFVNDYACKKAERKNLCISVGRLSKEKGFDRLIDIWKNVVAIQNNWKLLIIGDGPERDNLEHKAILYGIDKSIEFKGFLKNTDTLELMNESKIYLMTSYTEAFPFTLIEAMQNYLPIISFDVRTGPHSLIKNFENGFLIKDGDNDAFVKQLILLMQNDSIIKQLGINAENMSKMYSETNIMKLWQNIL